MGGLILKIPLSWNPDLERLTRFEVTNSTFTVRTAYFKARSLLGMVVHDVENMNEMKYYLA